MRRMRVYFGQDLVVSCGVLVRERRVFGLRAGGVVFAAGLVVLSALALFVGGLGLLGRPRAVGGGFAVRPGVSRLVREVQRRRWLESRAAVSQRAVSRMAFHGLDASRSRLLLSRDFGSVLAGVRFDPTASLGSGARIVRYLGNYRALVRTPHGLRLIESTAPLRVSSRGGVQRPVNLGLVSTGRGFAPRTAVAPIVIAKRSRGGVAFGSDGLRIAFEGSDVAGSVVGDQNAFFAGVAGDTDAVVAPTLDGAELSVVLRSRLSPQELRYHVSLPDGAVLRAQAGGAVVDRAGKAVARIAPPTARDAQDSPVPVTMTVAGDQLVLAVAHRRLDVAYPVFVDPKVATITASAERWAFSQTGLENFESSVGGGLSIKAPETKYPATRGSERIESSEGKWLWKAPPTFEVTGVEFRGLSFSASSVNETKHEPAQGVHWEIGACHRGDGGNVNFSPPPPTNEAFVGERGTGVNCEERVGFTLSTTSGGEHVTDSGTFSVESIVITARWLNVGHQSEEYGEENEAQPEKHKCLLGHPVNCATGNQTEDQTDLAVGGRGPAMEVRRTYNSQLAAGQTEPGVFGYGWTGFYNAHIAVEKPCEGCLEVATVYENNGSTARFEFFHGEWCSTQPLDQASLVKEGSGYLFTLADQTKLKFTSGGFLSSEVDRNGNALTFTRNLEGRLESIADPAGRKMTFAYNGSGEVESATDPMGHTVKYTYEAGNLSTVTQPASSSVRWKFKYNASHEMTEMTNGRGNTTTTEYNGSHQVVAQTDPLGRKREWKYGTITEGTYTEITEPNGSVTREEFNLQGFPVVVTKAYGTALAATTSYEYTVLDYLVAATDPDKHTTTYTNSLEGDRLSETDADGDKAEWTYDTTHDIVSHTTPGGETTTIKRDAHGNPETVERPAPGGKTEITKYKYASNGDLESVIDSLEHTWKYEYDSYGDRTAETDPEGNKRTWTYNEDSQETSTVSPRGNVAGGEPSRYKTTIERDAQGRPLTVTGPLGEPVYKLHFGSSGSGAGQFKGPTSAAVDASGNVWVNDREQNRIEKFTASGTFIQAMGFGVSNGEAKYQTCTTTCQEGILGSGSGQFNKPSGIAVNQSTGNVYVVDSGNSRVEVFSASGTFLKSIGSSGSGLGQLSAPTQDGIDSSGDLWVVDYGNSRFEEFSAEGTTMLVGGWGVKDGKKEAETCTTTCQAGIAGSGAGQFFDPQTVAFSGGNVYVDDRGNNRIEEFSSTGTYIRQFGTLGSGNGQFSAPFGIAANPANGDLYVTDRENSRVEELTPTGTYILTFGTSGSGNGQLTEPKGITVNTSGSLYIVDGGNTRIEQWTVAPRITKYAYDGDGNLEAVTDPDGNTTKYTYDADNEPTKIEEPNGTVTETGYDSMGQVTGQTDGNKHATEYKRNLLEETTEETNPAGRKTKKEYDAAGNLKTLEDPAKRTTTYTYDPVNRLKEVSYSDGKTHAVEYEYNKDGEITAMKDGSGTTKDTYDQLDRLTETENGHKETIKYEYNLANDTIKLTYPNGKAVTRTYDKDSRLEKVTDWLEHATTFGYDPDSDLASTTYPSETKDEDKYAYNDADQLSEAKMNKSTETLASLHYTRDNEGQVNTTISNGLPGEEKLAYEHDPNNRLTTGPGATYEYDAANNPTKQGSNTYNYTAADELEKSTGYTYTYNETGQRTKTTPTTGPATTYSYDQAGNLTSTERPKEGATPEINDTYTYNGQGLRTSETISGTTNYLAWSENEGLPLLLNNGTYSFIYGPGDLPIEQINNSTGTVTYLHHDQQGSTRLLTGSTGKVEGAYTYTPYGGVQEHTGSATTPLGYDRQYTSSDTGLIYLRARVYDPSTGQFLSVDPLVATTRAPYTYASDSPLSVGDPRGLCNANPFSESFWTEGNCISESPLNPIPYYEKEIESYENGCGYFASVAHGLEGALAGTVLFAGGEGEDEAGVTVEDALAGLTPGDSPGVYTVDSPEELQQIYDELSAGGKPTGSSYPGQEVELPDGTRVGIRETSKTGGPTVDINTGSTRYKIHLAE